MHEVEFEYRYLTPTQYHLKLNTVVCWLIENKIKFEMLYKFPTDDSVTGVIVFDINDAMVLRLMFGV